MCFNLCRSGTSHVLGAAVNSPLTDSQQFALQKYLAARSTSTVVDLSQITQYARASFGNQTYTSLMYARQVTRNNYTVSYRLSDLPHAVGGNRDLARADTLQFGTVESFVAPVPSVQSLVLAFIRPMPTCTVPAVPFVDREDDSSSIPEKLKQWATVLRQENSWLEVVNARPGELESHW